MRAKLFRHSDLPFDSSFGFRHSLLCGSHPSGDVSQIASVRTSRRTRPCTYRIRRPTCLGPSSGLRPPPRRSRVSCGRSGCRSAGTAADAVRSSNGKIPRTVWSNRRRQTRKSASRRPLCIGTAPGDSASIVSAGPPRLNLFGVPASARPVWACSAGETVGRKTGRFVRRRSGRG